MARKPKNCIGQLPLIEPESDWRPPSLSDLPSWGGVKRIGLDTEGRDPMLKKLGPGVRRKDSHTVGISFAFEDGPSFYLPFRHKGGDNLDEKHVLQYMKDQAKIFTGAICGANLQYDLDFLAEEGIVFRQATFKDIQIAEPLIDENKFSYSLQNISEKYGFPGKDEKLLTEVAKAYGIDPKADLWQLPARYVGAYAEVDAELPLQILRKQERILEDEDLWPIYELECQVLPVLVKMRRRGVRIDFDQLERVEEVTMEKETEFLKIIHDKTGVKICLDEINKTKLVIKACDVAQIPYGRTPPSKTYPDGQPSVKREYLEPNADHPVVNAILEARSYNKIRNTFVESIRKHETNGRIHCTFNQLRRQDDNSDEVKGAGPGRLSCVPKTTSEILTTRGWKMWDELQLGEDVMGYNILTESYEWTPLQKVYDVGLAPVGMITAVRGHGAPGPISLPQGFYCTQEHRWVVHHPSLSGFTAAGDNLRNFRKLLVPTKEMPAPKDSLLTPDQAFVFGWYLTDGWLRKSKRQKRYSMCVGVLKKSSITQLSTYLSKYNLTDEYTHRTYLKKFQGDDHRRTVHYFYFRSHYFHNIYTKIAELDPSEVILGLSKSAREAMFTAMLEGDRFGAEEDHAKKTHEFFSLLSVAEGQPYSVARTLTKAGTKFLNYQLIQDEILSNKNRKWRPEKIVDVWCPQTALGTWVMRQGKRICVTGNSCSPNLQQQPARHPVLGKMWRSIYLPDEGGQWCSLDYCFSADTEVLTEHGFVPFPQLSRNVKVAQYWPSGLVTYAMPKAYQVVPYSGEMYHIHGERQIDLLVSPNHRCALLSPDGRLSFQRADETWSSGKIVPQNGITPGTLSLPNTIVQQAAVIQADGSYRTSHYRVFLGKDRKIERLTNILGRAEDYRCRTKAAGYAFKLEPNPLIVPGKTKVFNREALMSLTSELRTLFLDELLHWDGTQSKSTYHTAVKENAEIVQELACLTGYRSNCVCKPQPGHRKDLYAVTLNHRSGTYVKTLEKSIEPYNGTIYCVTMPAGTLVVRRKGRVAVTGNSQQEPRLFVHFAHICGCPGTQPAIDGFEAGFDWHDMTTEMAFGIRKIDDPVLFKLMRKKAKAVFLGLTYGMGQAKMCRSCGFSTEKIHIRGAQREVAGPEGQAFLEEFTRKVPFLKDIKNRVERVAWNRRYIRTILGRHIHYPPARNAERKALNNLIQGSAADQTKLAMVLLDKENYKIQLQIHDEIAITVYDENTAKEMAEIMTTCVPLVVPSKVDIEIGANWGDSMK